MSLDERAAERLAPPLPRRQLLETIVTSASSAGPKASLLRASRGWGKSALLAAAAARCEALGLPVLRADLRSSVTSPEEFSADLVGRALDTGLAALAPDRVLPRDEALIERLAGGAAPFPRLRALAASELPSRVGRLAGLARELVEDLSRRRSLPRAAVDLALEAPRLLAEDLEATVVLSFDHLEEFQRLGRFPGLTDAPARLARRLAAAPALRLIGAVSTAGRPRPLLSALREQLGGDLAVHEMPPLGAEEIAGLLPPGAPSDLASMVQAVTGGRESTASLIGARLHRSLTLEEALFEEMRADGGRLHQELRFDYHLLIERTRGHAAERAILHIVAREEGIDLSMIAARLRRANGPALDYIRWLLEVGLLAREGRRYRFADPLMRLYVILHELPERPAGDSDRQAAVRRYLLSLRAEPVALRPRGRPRGSRAAVAATPPAPGPPKPRVLLPERPPVRHDDLMEID